MLILRRKSGESIVIGDNITLTVMDINEGSVRLAIDAPKSITILRSELLQAADANRDSAAVGPSPSPGLFRLLENGRGQERVGRRRPVKPGALSAAHPPKSPDASAPETSGAASPANSGAPTPETP